MTPTTLNPDAGVNLLAMLPHLMVVIVAAVVIVLDVFWKESQRRQIGIVAAVGLFATAGAALLVTPPANGPYLILGGMYRFDTLSQLFVVITLVATAIACLISMDSPGIGRKGEFYAVMIISALGAMLMSGAADLILVFLALETLSVSLYILAGFLRENPRSAEAGMKYYLFGSFTSAIMLYGLSLLYGFTGQTNLYAIGERLAVLPPENILPILLALVMVTVGFGFKISAVPFHFWTPDVYEGAPTPVTAYVSVVSKAASFAMLARFFLIVFQGTEITQFWVQFLAVVAVVTMTLGNVLALPQRNIKRLLAYSSIAQAGYVLIGVVSIAAGQGGSEPGSGVAAVGFYMAMYVLTNLAGFGAIILFTNATGSEEIADLAGLGRRNLGLALALTIALLSLAGIPPAAGFVGKLFLFRAAVDANLTWLAVIGVLNSIVALYYYLVVIKVMFVNQGKDEEKPIPVAQSYVFALAFSCIVVLLIGTVLIDPLYRWALTAAQTLFS